MAEGHPDRGRFLAHLDGELTRDERRAFRRHLEECRRCRRRLEELEAHDDVFSQAAARLDRPVPEMANPASDDGGSGAAVRSAGFPPLRAAAAVILLLVGGALITPPGRALAERALSGIAGLFRDEPAAPVATAGRDTNRDRRPTAASASSRDGRLDVVIESADSAAGVLRLGTGARGQAVVEGRLRDVERGPGRLRVRVDALDGVRVRLPDSIGSAEVRVNGRPVLRQRGRELIPAVSADTVDGGLLLRVGS